MLSEQDQDEREYDKVTQASLNGIYIKAQELDRGHNAERAPQPLPPGALVDERSHASDGHEPDVTTHASAWADAETHASENASEW